MTLDITFDYVRDPKSDDADTVREEVPWQTHELGDGCVTTVSHMMGDRVVTCPHYRKWAVRPKITLTYESREVH